MLYKLGFVLAAIAVAQINAMPAVEPITTTEAHAVTTVVTELEPTVTVRTHTTVLTETERATTVRPTTELPHRGHEGASNDHAHDAPDDYVFHYGPGHHHRNGRRIVLDPCSGGGPAAGLRRRISGCSRLGGE
ncbi:hypothetical protein C2E23DRAFT_565169 [Lenzites betulinus]|nr:hypothetical protein C2E23DRAFT_565169 [Lenzites betulinus]